MITRLSAAAAVAFVLALLWSLPAFSHTIFDELHYAEVLKVTLEFDLRQIRDDAELREYQTAVLRYQDREGTEREWLLKVKARGKFRLENCDFPPLRLKFSKEELERRGYDEHNKLKLVTHCLDARAYGRDYVLREYLTYRFLNELTPNSYRVQLVQITYQDSEKKSRQLVRWGFILEDTDELAERIGGEECDCYGLHFDQLPAENAATLQLFQFMIGNADWDLPSLRNVKSIRLKDSRAVVVVPYDFDFSGFVNAYYALPNPNLDQSSVRERILVGPSPQQEELRDACQRFVSRKQEFVRLINSMDQISRDSRNDCIDYLESFFTRDVRGLL